MDCPGADKGERAEGTAWTQHPQGGSACPNHPCQHQIRRNLALGEDSRANAYLTSRDTRYFHQVVDDPSGRSSSHGDAFLVVLLFQEADREAASK